MNQLKKMAKRKNNILTSVKPQIFFWLILLNFIGFLVIINRYEQIFQFKFYSYLEHLIAFL
jgi:hypothetical protein